MSLILVQEIVYYDDKKKFDNWDGIAEESNGEIPQRPRMTCLAEYLDSMRNNRPDLFRKTVKIYLPILCGKKLWEMEKASAEKTISQIVSISDEAMLLMVLENCWDHWRLVAKHK